MMLRIALFYVSLISLYCKGIEAWPTGSGHCNSGTPSNFEKRHGSTGSGGLESGDLTISSTTGISNPEKDEITTLQAGTEYTLTIETAGGEKYKGFFVRLSDKSGADVSEVLTESSGDAKSLSFCESNVAGITHTNNNLKAGISMTIKSDVPSQLLLEVTLVTENSSTVKNAYYFSEYELTLEEPNPDDPKTDDPKPTPGPTPMSSGSSYATRMVFPFALSLFCFTLLS